MTPSQQCKSAGLNGLRDLIEATGQSAQTLTNWQKNKPELFAIVIAGTVATKQHKPAN